MAEKKPKPDALKTQKAEDKEKAPAASKIQKQPEEKEKATPIPKTKTKAQTKSRTKAPAKTSAKPNPKPKPKEKPKPAKRGKYHRWLEPDGLTLLEAWARDGLTNEMIAAKCGITGTTLYVWMNDHPAISEALKKGKEVVDAEVENTLLKRAFGYEYIETMTEVGPMGKKRRETTKMVLPDVAALIFWLKNRKPGIWRDRKPSEHEADDAFIQLELEKAKAEAERSKIALEKERIELKMLKTMAGETTDNALTQMKSLYDLMDNPAPNRTIDEILEDETVASGLPDPDAEQLLPGETGREDDD